MITQININNPETELRIELPVTLREGDLIDLEFIIDKSIESYYKTNKEDFLNYMEDYGSTFIVVSSCLIMQGGKYEWKVLIKK